MSLRKSLTGMSVVLALLVSTTGVASDADIDSRKEIKAARDKPFVRGGIVYKNYCVLCHGERGDGMARATKLYGEGNLAIKERPQGFYEKIIRGGGEAVGLSKFMPTWDDELSDEQITDVIDYLATVRNPIDRGHTVFKTNCILCHGVKGNGKGRASVMYDPPPADLTHSDKNDDYKRMIITMGGAAMGRSSVMPQWGLQLTEQEIEDVVAFLRTILVKPQ